MRERWAKCLALLTGVLVVLMSALFAWVQNAPGPARDPAVSTSAPLPPAASKASIAAGRATFAANGCARCHAIAGQGNPRSPLDGIGARRDRAQLRAAVLGQGSDQTDLPTRVRAAKQAYAALPASELEALLDYLASLR